MVVHAFNLSIWEAEGGSEFEVSLIYRASSRTDRTTEKPCFEKDKQANKQKKPQKQTNKKNPKVFLAKMFLVPVIRMKFYLPK